jgi:hypothetical protein
LKGKLHRLQRVPSAPWFHFPVRNHVAAIAFNQHREDSNRLAPPADIPTPLADLRKTMRKEYEFDKVPEGPPSKTEKAIFGYFIFIAVVAAATVSFAAVSFAISP